VRDMQSGIEALEAELADRERLEELRVDLPVIAERDELRERLQCAVDSASRKRLKIETVVDTLSAALNSMRDPA